MSGSETTQKVPVYDDRGKYDISTPKGFVLAVLHNVFDHYAGRFFKPSPRFLWTMIICGLIVLSGRLLNPVRIVGSSMEPTYSSGDLVMTSTSVSAETIDYDKVIVFDVPVESLGDDAKEGYKLVVKRVVGLPGDTIQIVNGVLYRNGSAVENGDFEAIDDPGVAADPIVLMDDEYFCLGDNRNNSVDCRYTGPVSLDEITHIVIRRIL